LEKIINLPEIESLSMLRLIFPLILVLTVLHGERSHAFGPGYTRINAAAESAETAYTNPAGMTRFDEKTTSATPTRRA
jgi:long-subunit fatty acid transport protein